MKGNELIGGFSLLTDYLILKEGKKHFKVKVKTRVIGIKVQVAKLTGPVGIQHVFTMSHLDYNVRQRVTVKVEHKCECLLEFSSSTDEDCTRSSIPVNWVLTDGVVGNKTFISLINVETHGASLSSRVH